MKKILPCILTVLCLLLLPAGAGAETRQGVIALEGAEEPIEETLYESPMAFSFWYASDTLQAYPGEAYGVRGVVVAALESDSRMALALISEEEADAYIHSLDEAAAEKLLASPGQADVYREMKNGRLRFLTLIAQNGQYLKAAGEYPMEAADGTGKYLQRVLDTVTLIPADAAELLRVLPGEWAEEYEGAAARLTLGEGGEARLECRGADSEEAYTCEGAWSFEYVPEEGGELTLHFTSTDHPLWANGEYSAKCVYAAYTESWVENDTLITYLILNPPISIDGVSPFEALYGEDGAALRREQGPNMRVVKCKEYVSLRETRSTAAKRLEKVPLGALVLAFPEAGEENGFIYCMYQGQEGYILADYLQPVQ